MSEIKTIPIDKIQLGDFRIRTSFNAEKMDQLESSIKRKGVIIPIQVRDLHNGFYELVAGERRLRASKASGATEILANIRPIDQKDVLVEMAIENILREDLGWYEKGRWVAKMKNLGWTITSLSEETGIDKYHLSEWIGFYEQSEQTKSVGLTNNISFEPNEIQLRSMLSIKRSPISEKKKAELAIEASQMKNKPTVSEIQQATQLIEREPLLSAKEAIERSRSLTVLLPVPMVLVDLLRSQAEAWDLSFQDAIVRIVREYLE